MQSFTILCLGDTVGEAAVAAIRRRLPSLRRELQADAVIINAENSHAGAGNGTSAADAALLFAAGADCLTGGNHSLRQRDLDPCFERNPAILRPLNLPAAAPGAGDCVIDCAGVRVLVMNVMGRVFMDPCDDPVVAVERALAARKGEYDLSVLDIHAEATSEKFALAAAFDGKIDLIFGTHTHVPTSDGRILPGGSVFQTDIGMCGPRDSCLGIDPACVLRKMRTGIPQKFLLSTNPVCLQGIVVRFEGSGFSPLRPASVLPFTASEDS